MSNVEVTLAYPYKSHKADDTVSLPPDEASRLLSDGKARPPESRATRPRHDSGTGRTKEK